MTTIFKRSLVSALAVAAAAIATHAAAEVTFYQDEGFRGPAFTAERDIWNLQRFGFNDRASSIVVQHEPWEVCQDARFEGRCVVLRPGRYPSVSAMGLNDRISSVRPAAPNQGAYNDRRGADRGGPPRITFYEHDGFRGGSFTADGEVPNFNRFGFNDRASSIDVRGGRWEVCEDVRFNGRCVTLRPGRYASISEMGLNDRISSVRPVGRDERAQAGYGVAGPDFRRREGERLYEAQVTSVRAVVGTPQQQCWVEREQISSDRSQANVPGAIAGAVIGGILGHQVGGGSGKDAATALGVIGGAALGANVGQGTTQDVQRCTAPVGQARPDYWDVTYYFNGQEHHVLMSTPPGRSVTVNDRGEPRA